MIKWYYLLTTIFIMLLVCVFTLSSYSGWQKASWFYQVEYTLESKKNMQLEVVDTSSIPVIFELHKIDLTSPQFSELISALSTVHAQAFTPMAVELLKKNPDFITTVSFYKPFEPYFKKVGINNVDWSLVYEKIQETEIKTFQTKALALPKDTIGRLIIARDAETYEMLGLMKFSVSTTDAYGTIYINFIGFKPNAQHRGLGKLMISSLFKMIPDTGHICLRVQETNTVALNAYYSYDFRKYIPQKRHFDELDAYSIFLKYKVDQSNVLQKVAETIIERTVH